MTQFEILRLLDLPTGADDQPPGPGLIGCHQVRRVREGDRPALQVDEVAQNSSLVIGVLLDCLHQSRHEFIGEERRE